MADALLSLAHALDDQNASTQALLLARMAGFLAPGSGDVALLIAQINLVQGNPAEAVIVLEDVPAIRSMPAGAAGGCPGAGHHGARGGGGREARG
jgi:hypothetical protein